MPTVRLTRKGTEKVSPPPATPKTYITTEALPASIQFNPAYVLVTEQGGDKYVLVPDDIQKIDQ